MRDSLALLLALLWLASPLSAQVDIESQRRDAQAGFSGSVSLDLTLREGNVELFQFGPGLSLGYGREQDALILIGKGDLGWQGGERFSNEALTHLRYVRALGSRLYTEAFGQVNYDHARRLDFRRLAGSGVRLSLIDSGASSFWLGSALMYEHERNDVAADHPEATTSLVRWSNYLSANIQLSESARLSGTTYVQPAARQFDDYRLLGDASLSVSLTETLSLATSLSFQRDSDPLEGVDGGDLTLSTGLAFDWN